MYVCMYLRTIYFGVATTLWVAWFLWFFKAVLPRDFVLSTEFLYRNGNGLASVALLFIKF
jgi:hypothetical protein